MSLDQLAAAFILTGVLERIVDELSVQQRRLLGCCTAMLEAVDLLILDEPTAGLDNAGRRALRGALTSLVGTDLCVLILSHDEEFLASVCNAQLRLEAGQIKHFRRRPGPNDHS
jgi:ATPase subunit of ABC transporter with duplicated ATPase domains